MKFDGLILIFEKSSMLIPKCQYNDVIRNLRLYKQDTLYIIKFLATLYWRVFGFNNQISYFYGINQKSNRD